MYEKLFQLHELTLRALANSRRLEIIHLLRDQELCVGDIHTMLDLPQANISQHLMVLKEAHLVTVRKEGKQIFYKLAHPHIITASDLIREMLVETRPKLSNAQPTTLNLKELVPLVHDPVCGMRISPKTAGFSLHHNNEEYYFCASGCLKAFQKEPTRYASH